MRAQSTTQADSTFNITPPAQPRMPWRVVLVEALPDLKLQVRFVDGTEGTVDLTALVNSPDAGVFAILADPSVFNEVFIQHGAVTWPGDMDLAPDAMYAAIKQTGTWVLQ